MTRYHATTAGPVAYTPEEEAERDAMEAAIAESTKRLQELKVSRGNAGVRLEQKIKSLEELLDRQLDSDDIAAIETQQLINTLRGL